MRFLRFVSGLAVLSSVACSSDEDGGQAIDCSWFTAPNCWREVADAAYACTNDARAPFDAARSQCTAADVTVTFAQPVPESLFDDETYKWNLTVTRGGTECARIVETEGGIDVKSPAGQFRQTVQGTNMVLECPDGSRYSIGGFAALGCGFDNLPGYAYSQSTSTLAYSLLGSGDHGGAQLFTCTAAGP